MAATQEIVRTRAPRKLWEHKDPESTETYKFLQHVNSKYGKSLDGYDDLYQWSIDNISDFWAEVWDYTGVRGKRFDTVVDERAPMFPRPAFFAGAQLNFAQNLLFPNPSPAGDAIAVIQATERGHTSLSWHALRARVTQYQAAMAALGLQPGERVAGYVGNHAEALVGMLAAVSLGGVWTAVSPDTGVHAVLERLVQVAPRLLFVDNAAAYNGKVHRVVDKVAQIAAALPSLQSLVVLPAVPGVSVDLGALTMTTGKSMTLESFLALGDEDHELVFPLFPPEQPVYILYSSGTTGAPKCIVHGSAGTLLQHKKEHVLHCSMGPGSRMLYFTTVSWMMWHWLVSALASGVTIVLYDGSPFRRKSDADPSGSVADDLAMPRLIQELGITHFGTSAKYLSVLEQKKLKVKDSVDVSTLQAIYSTGSPLAPSTFEYTYEAFGADFNLGSITGGTDIISLFGAPSLLSPVYSGEIQKPGLGMAIKAYDYAGNDITSTGDAGDLICIKPFPSQPVSFWGADGAAKYNSSYFDTFTDVGGHPIWHHGDFVRFNPATGGLVMLGRSDGILKPAGVRFGSAEIYNVLQQWFASEVSDALCIGRRREADLDETVVLFVKMAPGKVFDAELVARIRRVIREELSARHVPGMVDECVEIPVTSNGKKIEGAVKQILCGLSVKTSASVANAECLDWYREWAKSH